MRFISFLFIALTFIQCSNVNSSKSSELDSDDGWKTDCRVSKIIDGHKFDFPASGHAYEIKDSLVVLCLEAMDENLKMLEIQDTMEQISTRFYITRDDMYEHEGMAASGLTNSFTKEIYLLCYNEKDSVTGEEHAFIPPIQHEFMHMVAQLKWGYPQQNMYWANEGLATFAPNDCNGYSVAEIYRSLLEQDKLLSMDSLTSDFYATDEMVGYHQSAYIVEYLISTYGLEKFKSFWQKDYNAFEEVYGFPSSDLIEKTNESVLAIVPVAPAINWEEFVRCE